GARCDAERRAELPEDVPALLVGFLVGVGDAHADDVAAMLGRRRESDPRSDVVVEVVDLVDDVERRGERHVRVAVLGGPPDRFGTDDARNPYRRGGARGGGGAPADAPPEGGAGRPPHGGGGGPPPSAPPPRRR